jgi:hypothetical protein
VTDFSAYRRAILRFRWVVWAGVALGIGIAFLVSVTTARTYTATSQLLVTSPQAPFFRLSVNTIAGVFGGPRAPNADSPVTAEPPDTDTLTNAANLYPLLVESDPVARQREAMFGKLPGKISSRAIYAVLTQSRYEPSSVPVVDVFGIAKSKPHAINMAEKTAAAFIAWMKIAQNQAHVSPSNRIVVDEIRSARPDEVKSSGGAGKSLLMLVFLLIVVGACALAVLLDRLYPDRATAAPAPTDGEPVVDATAEPAAVENVFAAEAAAASANGGASDPAGDTSSVDQVLAAESAAANPNNGGTSDPATEAATIDKMLAAEPTMPKPKRKPRPKPSYHRKTDVPAETATVGAALADERPTAETEAEADTDREADVPAQSTTIDAVSPTPAIGPKAAADAALDESASAEAATIDPLLVGPATGPKAAAERKAHGPAKRVRRKRTPARARKHGGG